jgi:hypothetical protein
VDRPSSGRRRHDAESGTGTVTVVDLIRREQGPVRIPSADEAATIQFTMDLLGEPDPAGPPDEPEHGGWLHKGAKLAGLAFGSILLCGSVYAASTLTHRGSGGGDPALSGNALADTVLTGAGALRPDEVAAQLSGATPDRPAPAARTPRSAPAVGTGVASGKATGTVVGTAPASPTAPTTTADSSGSVSSGRRSATDVVRSFYDLLAKDPGLATEWLSPNLLAGDGLGFDQAWASLRRIELESVRQTTPNTVQAVVRMQEPDGSWLRVVVRLHVTSGARPLINGAQLLSAQRG